jgi:hypothetical protein
MEISQVIENEIIQSAKTVGVGSGLLLLFAW